MGKKLKEIRAQTLAFDLIKKSRYWVLVFPKYLGGPRFAPAVWKIETDEDLRRFLLKFTNILRSWGSVQGLLEVAGGRDYCSPLLQGKDRISERSKVKL